MASATEAPGVKPELVGSVELVIPLLGLAGRVTSGLWSCKAHSEAALVVGPFPAAPQARSFSEHQYQGVDHQNPPGDGVSNSCSV